MTRPQGASTAALLLALAMTAACGSTVQSTSTGAGTGGRQATGDGLGGDPQAPGSAGGAGGDASVPGGASPAAGGALSGPAGGPGGAVDEAGPVGGPQGTGPAGGTSSGGVAPGRVPGVTATTISFGVVYTTSMGEANKALGAGGQDSGDVRNYYNILVKDVNAHGGVLGRKLKPVYFDLGSSSATTTQQAAQEECEHFTKDHSVFAVFGEPNDLMRACAQQAGILHLASGGNSTALTFQQFPNYFEFSARLERIARATVDGLASTDYFQRGRNATVGSKPVLGLITWDEGSYRRALEQGYVPALRRRGMSLKATARVAAPYAEADASTSAAGISNAVLKFRQAGVTHVFIQDGPAGACAGSCLTLLWLRNASSQGYFPRYGFNDSNSAKAGYDAGLWTGTDVDDSRYVTWADRDAYADQGVGVNKTRELCLKMMKDGGVTIDNETAKSYALMACNLTWLLRAGLRNGPGRVDVASMIAGVNGLGSSFSAGTSYAVRFSPSQHDGTAAYRIQGFNDGAWRWLSGVKPMA